MGKFQLKTLDDDNGLPDQELGAPEGLNDMFQENVFVIEGVLKGTPTLEQVLTYHRSEVSLWKSSLAQFLHTYGVKETKIGGMHMGELRPCVIHCDIGKAKTNFQFSFLGLFSGYETLGVNVMDNSFSLTLYKEDRDIGEYGAETQHTKKFSLEQLPEIMELCAQYLLEENTTLEKYFVDDTLFLGVE